MTDTFAMARALSNNAISSGHSCKESVWINQCSAYNKRVELSCVRVKECRSSGNQNVGASECRADMQGVELTYMSTEA